MISLLFAFFYQNQYANTLSDYNSLKSDYDSLSLKNNLLQSNYNEKVSEYNSLQISYNEKANDYNSLQNSYNKKVTDFNSLQSQYDFLDIRYDSMNSSYNSIMVRTGAGNDCKLFVTPDDSSVKTKTREVLGSGYNGSLTWDDKRKINNWVYDNIAYNHDTFIGSSQDCFLYPKETLSLRYGDCEDHAVLMASMCKAEEDVSWVYCASISYTTSSGETVGHVFVINDIVDNQMHIFDPTSGDGWGNGWDSGTSKSEPEAIRQYEEYFHCSSLRVNKIFNEDMCIYFGNNQEFFDFL